MRSRFLVVVLAAIVIVTAVPQSRAQAFAPPVPIAPPITGLCATPWGAVACLGAAGAGAITEGLVWWDNTVGLTIDPADGGWCVTDTGHMFAQGASACNPSVPINESDALVEQATEEFEPSTASTFDPYETQIWVPAPSETCPHGVCIEEVIARPIDNDQGYEIWANTTGGDPCPVKETVGEFPQHFPNQVGQHLTPGCTVVHLHVSMHSVPDPPAFRDLPVWDEQIDCNNGWEAEHKTIYGGQTPYQSWRIVDQGDRPDLCHKRMRQTDEDPLAAVAVAIVDGSGNMTQTQWVTVTRSEFEGVYQGRVQCRQADGTIIERVNQGAQAFPIGAGGVLPLSGCEPGEVPVEFELEYCDPNNPQVCITVADWSSNIDPNEVDTACIQALSGPNPCPMWLEYYDGSSWLECVPSTAGPCTDWWTNPARDINFRCGWGGDYYTASQCQVLKEWYNVDNPDPETEIIIVNPNDPADPGTDAPIGDPDPDTGLIPGTITGPSSPPSSRPSPNWLQRAITEWSTGSTTDLQGSCWPQGWGLLNPLQWVMRPIMCALTYLFVPTTPVQTQLETFYAEAATTTKLGIVYDSATLLATVPAPAVGGGCGWGVPETDLPAFTVPETQLIMCPSDFGLTAQASTTRSFGYGVLGLWVAGMVYRWVGLGRSDELPLEADNVTGNL